MILWKVVVLDLYEHLTFDFEGFDLDLALTTLL